MIVETASAEDTERLGARVGALLQGGDVVVLAGPIGAGKTVLAKGIARGLEVDDVVTSPTFALHAVYEGRLTLNHFDFYRLDAPEEAVDLAVAEVADARGVAVVEWGDRFPGALPEPYLRVDLEPGADPDARRLRFHDVGGGWTSRLDAVRDRVG